MRGVTRSSVSTLYVEIQPIRHAIIHSFEPVHRVEVGRGTIWLQSCVGRAAERQ